VNTGPINFHNVKIAWISRAKTEPQRD